MVLKPGIFEKKESVKFMKLLYIACKSSKIP